MVSSELILKKKLTVLPHFLNILNTFFIKHGRKKYNFFVLSNFLFNLKNSNQLVGINKVNSAFIRFYNFVSKLTPRINVVSVENKKAGKVFKIPMPPLKNSLLQHNFLVAYARTIKSSNEYKKFTTQLFQNYKESFINERSELFKNNQQSYEVLKEHKFRAKKRHDKLIKIKKLTIKNANKKSKQFYI